jgi:hypothetical protein
MRGVILRVGGVVVGSLALGLLGGWLWWTWWAPATPGKIYDVPGVGPTWFPDPWDPGMTDAFGGTAQYVLVAAGLGLVLGILAGLFAGRTALAVLGAVVVGSVGAAWLMLWFGTSFSPPDPATLATEANVGEEVPGSLEVTEPRVDLLGWDDVPLPTPYAAWPIAALTGFVIVMLSGKSVSDLGAREPDATTWLEPLSPSRGQGDERSGQSSPS